MNVRRRSMGLREYGEGPGYAYSNCSSLSGSSCGSPVSRRRSMSPLYAPMGQTSAQMLERNKKEPSFPQTEDEHLYLFHERIIWKQEKSLLPLAHDLSDWINSTLGINLTPATLMESLQTGVTLCNLAKLIENKADSTPGAKVKPKLRGKVRTNATRESFFARDNIAMFIHFCKELGVHSNLLFETEDLVTHGEVRSILICLMEVGRLSVQFGIEPPALVVLEHQMEKECCGDSQRTTTTDEESQDENNKENPKPKFRPSSIPVRSLGFKDNLSDSRDSGLPADDEQGGAGDMKSTDILLQTTELDLKVNEVARISGKDCSCVEQTRQNFKLRKLSEGKYQINGRTVFVRLLKGVHVMVRIGGGWETLEEFLVRHDPCRGRTPGVRRRASFGVFATHSGINTPKKLASPSGSRPGSTPPIMGNGNLQTGPTSRYQYRPRSSMSACTTPTVARSPITSRNSLLSCTNLFESLGTADRRKSQNI